MEECEESAGLSHLLYVKNHLEHRGRILKATAGRQWHVELLSCNLVAGRPARRQEAFTAASAAAVSEIERCRMFLQVSPAGCTAPSSFDCSFTQDVGLLVATGGPPVQPKA